MTTPLTILARHWTSGSYVYEAATVLARVTDDALLVRFADGQEQGAFDAYCGIPAEHAAAVAALPVDRDALTRDWANA